MGFYHYLEDTWRNLPREASRERLIQLRKEPAIVRVERPTKLHRAHALGYRAKQGFVIARVKVSRSRRMRESIRRGRRSRHYRHHKVVSKGYQWIAEERAQRKYVNCEVLNSYKLAEDGKWYWFEVILVDTHHPVIQSDPHMAWITQPQHTGRVFRGLTSAGRKSRGLRSKGIGAEKVRPSQRAQHRRAH